MTKKQMLDFIETTGMVVDFNRNFLMKRSKEYIKGLYDMAVRYATKEQ